MILRLTEGVPFVLFALGTASIALRESYPGLYRLLLDEDGVIEQATAAAFFAVVVFLFRAYRRSRGMPILVLAIFFFFLFGEELSWGQRIFGFSTPAWMLARNAQGEISFHNLVLNGLDIETGVYLLIAAVSGPSFFAEWNRLARDFLARLGVPLFARWRGGVVAAAALLLFLDAPMGLTDAPFEELAELVFACQFCLGLLEFSFKARARQ